MIQDTAPLSDENWPALSEVTEVSSPTVTKPKGQIKPVPSPTVTTNNNSSNQSNNNQSNSDSGGDDSSKENKENTSSNDEGQRTPKKKGITHI